MRDTISSARAHGRYRLHRVYSGSQRRMRVGNRLLPAGWFPCTNRLLDNTILNEWGAIFGNLLLRKGTQYGIGGMLIEFENVASPGDPVDVPAFERSDGIEYYDNLALSSTRDYLRIPLIAGTLETPDEEDFPKGNQPVFFAQSSGTTGVHGKTFSDTVNSVVFGAAMVAFVDRDDSTQDLILSRHYFDVAEQVAKLATSQVGVEWELTLE